MSYSPVQIVPWKFWLLIKPRRVPRSIVNNISSYILSNINVIDPQLLLLNSFNEKIYFKFQFGAVQIHQGLIQEKWPFSNSRTYSASQCSRFSQFHIWLALPQSWLSVRQWLRIIATTDKSMEWGLFNIWEILNP